MFSELINQNSFIIACYVITALYVGFANTLLSDKIKYLFNNEFVKLTLLLLIILIGNYSVQLSIAFTIIVLVSLILGSLKLTLNCSKSWALLDDCTRLFDCN